jgi:hypothetical protein
LSRSPQPPSTTSPAKAIRRERFMLSTVHDSRR